MLTSIVYRMAPIITKWFDENYGRHLIKGFLGNIYEPSVILDLGAGKGNDLAIAASSFPLANLYAIESYPPYQSLLKQNGIKVVELDIERCKLPFENESVDIVIINQVLEHTKDVFWILSESSRVLKCGGSLIIGVPNLAAWHNRVMLLLGIQPPAIATMSCHVRGFTRNDLQATLETGSGNKLKVVESLSAGFYPFPPLVARKLAYFLPNLGWSVHVRVNKIGSYHDEFLVLARSLNETNFFAGGN